MEASTIPKLQQEVAVLEMMYVLRDEDLKNYLRRKSFTTLAGVLGKANEFIKSEEIGRETYQKYVTGEGSQAHQAKKEPYKKEYADRRDNHHPRKDREVRIGAEIVSSELRREGNSMNTPY